MMTSENFYKSLGGDYFEVLSRFSDEKMLKKRLAEFPDDPAYSNLCIALKYGDIKGAYTSAESLLSVCKNLGFVLLAKSLSAVVESIKNGYDSNKDHMLSVLGSEYESTVYLIKKFLGKN